MDAYVSASEIAKELEAFGLRMYAERIANAISSGSTGTEICMGIRHELDAISSNPDFPENLTSRAIRLLEQLDELLA